MNSTESAQQDNATVEPPAFGVDPDWARIDTFQWVFQYVCAALGIPGNILSAIVWLRLHKKNSSAVYLAAIAINDLVFQLSQLSFRSISRYLRYPRWLFISHFYNVMIYSCATVEPLLTLGFSVERLLAICWPLKVLIGLSCGFHTQTCAKHLAVLLRITNRPTFSVEARFRLWAAISKKRQSIMTDRRRLLLSENQR